jgi:hypothetical protein
MLPPATGSLAVFGLLIASACSDYPHANPWDPASVVQIELTGPDTTYSVGEVVTFTFRTTPEWPNVVAGWSSSNETVLWPMGNGQFVVRPFGNGFGHVDVVLTLGPHSQRHELVLAQRFAKVAIVGCSASPCLSFGVLGHQLTLTAELRDALDYRLAEAFATDVNVTFRSTRPEVARIASSGPRSVTVESVSNGSSWMVASAGSSSDSVLVSVQQIPRALVLDPPCTERRLRVGQTLQLRVATALDGNNRPLPSVPDHDWSTAPYSSGGVTYDGHVSVSATGLVTAVSARPPSYGAGYVVATVRERPETSARCLIYVDP